MKSLRGCCLPLALSLAWFPNVLYGQELGNEQLESLVPLQDVAEAAEGAIAEVTDKPAAEPAGVT